MPVRHKGRALAYKILKIFAEREPPLSDLLETADQQIVDRREFSLFYELTLGVVRWMGKIDYILSLFSARPIESLDIPVKTALRLGLFQMLFLERIPHSAAVDESVKLVKKDRGLSGASFVNGLLRKISREEERIRFPGLGEDAVRSMSVVHSHPEWMVSRWIRRFGLNETEEMLAANNRHAPLSLWINTRICSVDAVAEELRRGKVAFSPSDFLDDAFVIQERAPQSMMIFLQGGCYLQDEASQMIPLIFGHRLSGRIADLCSAPGGKGLKLAQFLAKEGFVIGIDYSIRRMKITQANKERLKMDNYFSLIADIERGIPLKCSIDYVLLDAPCSGTGVIRRNPDIKWRLREDDFVRLSSRQLDMLERACGIVRRGGLLLYSVCSIEEEENEGVIDRFLKRNSDFRLEDPAENLPKKMRQFVDSRFFFRTFPHRHNLDGFFAALMRKIE